MQKIENHEQLKKYVEQERKRLEERKNKIKELVSNNSYINWLQEFTLKYPKFRDDDFLYNSHDLKENDIENINNLSLLYSGIKDYTINNFIYPFTESDFIEYYRIKYNNIGYEIGLITGQGSLFFCERVNKVDNTFIDFNDIIINKQQQNTEYIKKRLIELSSIITYLYEQKVPLNAIKSVINDTLWNIDEINNKNGKKFIKKYKSEFLI